MRGFTLIELMVVGAITAIMAAVAVPVVISAVEKNKQEQAAGGVALGINAGRDEARSKMRCVTVTGQLPPDIASTTSGLAMYLHNKGSWTGCGDSSTIDLDYPEDWGTVVGQVQKTGTSRVDILEPMPGCVGAPPPESCYQLTTHFNLHPDGHADKAYRVNINNMDGSREKFLVHPETGTLRRVGGDMPTCGGCHF